MEDPNIAKNDNDSYPLIPNKTEDFNRLLFELKTLCPSFLI